MVKEHQKPLLLVSSLLRALGHQIRTPLSIVSADLDYFKTLLDPDECERGIEKCRLIGDILKKASQLNNQSVELSEISLKELSTTLPFAKVESLEQKVVILPRALSFMVTELHDFLRSVAEREPDTSVLLSGNRNVKVVSEVFLSGSQHSIESSDSLTEFFSQGLSQDDTTPIVIDSLVWALSGTVRVVSHEEKIKVEVQV